MFKKRQEIDEIELGAELFLKGLKESRQTYATKSGTITPQKLETPT